VGFGCLDADAQPIRNDPVGHAGPDQLKNLPFTWRQFFGSASRLRPSVARLGSESGSIFDHCVGFRRQGGTSALVQHVSSDNDSFSNDQIAIPEWEAGFWAVPC
jgi:hypothetical protein